MAYELRTEFDSRKSFYGKARVYNENGSLILESYNTRVAKIENGKAVVYGLYTTTTTRHIKEFLKQNGFKAESSKQIWADYGEKSPKDKIAKEFYGTTYNKLSDEQKYDVNSGIKDNKLLEKK